jgi:Zn-dependent protease with chaperone function
LAGLIDSSLVTNKEVIVFHENSSKDPAEFFILPNGALFLSERLLEGVLQIGGIEGLSFILLHELAHLSKGDLSHNLSAVHPYGDLK